MKVFIPIELLFYLHITQADVTSFANIGDPLLGYEHQMRCTVTSFQANVFIYKTTSANIEGQTHITVCDSSYCLIYSGYTFTVTGRSITITIPRLTSTESNKYWTCRQSSTTRYMFLIVYSVPSSITLKGSNSTCDLGRKSCEFTCTTDNCTYPTPTFTWFYVLNDGTTVLIPHTSNMSATSNNCEDSMKMYEDTLIFQRYRRFNVNTEKTIRLQCYITFSGLSSVKRTSGVSQDVIFAVKVSVVQIFDDNTELTDNMITVNDEEEKLLKCTPGIGNPSPTIQWFLGNTLVSTESQFRFIPTNSHHDKRIYCVADNIPDGIDDAVSNKPILYVKVKMQFAYIEPAADTVVSAIDDTPEPVLCTTSAGRPRATIKWYKNDILLGEGNSTEFELTDSNLEVTKSTRYVKVLRSDSGWTLSCSVSNNNASELVKANNSKTFNVLYPPEHMSLLFDGKPVPGPVIDVTKGISGTLKCAATSNPPASLFSWNIKQKVGGTLTIDDNIQNGQIVNCTARNIMTSTAGITMNGYGSISKKINLQYGAIIERIEVNGHAGTTEIRENDPIMITCYVDSNPDSTISLFQGTNRLTETEQSEILNYNISSAQCSHTGQFTCRAENGIFGVEQPAVESVQVNVKCSPRLAYETDPSVFAQQNKTAILSLIVRAFPIPSKYYWYRKSSNNWKELTNTQSTQMSNASLQMALAQFSLILVRVEPEDYGEYKLTVDNSIDAALSFTFVLKSKEVPENASNDKIDKSTLAIVAGAMGSVLAIVIVVVVILVLIFWRNHTDDTHRKQDKMTYEMPNRVAQSSEERTYDTVNQSINEYENSEFK